MIINVDMVEKTVAIPGEVYGLSKTYSYAPVTMEVIFTEATVEVEL